MKRIVETSTYICDGCGKQFVDEFGHIGYPESDIWKKAYIEEWEEIDGKHYCPDCYEFDIDEETNSCINYRPIAQDEKI